MANYNRGRGQDSQRRREREDYSRQYGDQRGDGQRDRGEYEGGDGARSPEYGVEPPNYGRGRSYEGQDRTEQYDYPGGSYAQGAEYGRQGEGYARRDEEGQYGERRPSGRGDYSRQEFAGEQRYDERIYGAGRSQDYGGGRGYERGQGYGRGQNYGGPSDEQQYAAMEGYRGQGATPYGGGYGQGDAPSTQTGRSGYGEEQPRGYGQVGPASGQRRGGFRGRGPRNYRRSDERITEEINDRLTDHDELDAEDIEVSVTNCEVILTGTVDSRESKRLAEDIAEDVAGVTQVQNQLRVVRPGDRERGHAQAHQASPTERERSGRGSSRASS